MVLYNVGVTARRKIYFKNIYPGTSHIRALAGRTDFVRQGMEYAQEELYAPI